MMKTVGGPIEQYRFAVLGEDPVVEIYIRYNETLVSGREVSTVVRKVFTHEEISRWLRENLFRLHSLFA